MPYTPESAFYRLLATRYAPAREEEAIEILDAEPGLARLEWPGPDAKGQPFVKGSTALHYAANDGKLKLVERLIECGADMNDRRHHHHHTPLAVALDSGNKGAIAYLRSQGAAET